MLRSLYTKVSFIVNFENTLKQQVKLITGLPGLDYRSSSLPIF